MCIDENMNIYTSIEIVHICYIQNWYDTMTWPRPILLQFAYFKFYWKLQQLMYDEAAFQQIVLWQLN